MAYWDDNGECNLSISYDADGVPVSVAFDANIYDDFYDEDGNFIEGAEYSGIYYYVVNPQGDVIGLLDEDGNLVVEYVYDAWGAVREVHASGYYSYLARYNPLRYRGYVYDVETGLYYLQSRYYNPEMGRFINADGVVSGVGGQVLGYNMFAYCFNNPVNMDDSSGNWPSWNTIWKAAAIVATVVAVVAVATVAVVTLPVSSIATTIAVTSAITIVSKAAEVAVLQGRKSISEGKDAGQVTTDIIDSVFDNGTGTVTKTATAKVAGYSAGFYSQSSTFQDVLELQKLDGVSIKTMAGAASYEVANRFSNIKQCAFSTASKTSMFMSYGFAGLNAASLVISFFVDDPIQYATLRGYTLK